MNYLLTLIITALLFTSSLYAEPTSLLSISNDSIKIVVNNDAVETGRLAIETIKGDPQNPKDDNQPLIFGRPRPWTSYTTVLIDGVAYVFGGQTQKRAGKSAKYGTLISQKLIDNTIITVCQFNTVTVTQKLSLYHNPTTKAKDTALISYELNNTDTKSHNVGIRIMLDTMLGSNDGAPFRIGDDAIESEISFSGNSVLQYWQAFDSLVSPNIIAQGTLSDPQSGIDPPNKVYLANWGTLADYAWDTPYEKGLSFVRTGEAEKDTALAMYWSPKPLKPGSSYKVSTLYGLGQISLAKGKLSLGLTAPSQVVSSSKADLLIVGYIVNTTTQTANQCIATFTVPDGFKFLDGNSRITIGSLKPGESRQVSIRIVPNDVKKGLQKLTFSVASDNLPSNSISREINVLAQPEITSTWVVPSQVNPGISPYFDTFLTLKNNDPVVIPKVSLQMTLSKGVSLPWFELSKKEIERIEPGQSITLNWKVRADQGTTANIRLGLNLNSPLTKPKAYVRYVTWSRSSALLTLVPSDEVIKEGTYFYVQLNAQNLSQLEAANLQFDSSALYLSRTSPDLWVRKSGQSEVFTESEDHVDIQPLRLSADAKIGNTAAIGRFYFKALKKGATTLSLKHQNTEIKLNLIIQ